MQYNRRMQDNKDNKVILNDDDIIEVQVVGSQDVASVMVMGEKIEHLAASQRAAQEPVLVLDNILAMGEVPPDARKMVVDLGKKLDYDRLAMLGKGSILRIGANIMLSATGRGDKVKYFDNREQAVAWLKGPRSG
jgi:hypothetical protein